MQKINNYNLIHYQLCLGKHIYILCATHKYMNINLHELVLGMIFFSKSFSIELLIFVQLSLSNYFYHVHYIHVKQLGQSCYVIVLSTFHLSFVFRASFWSPGLKALNLLVMDEYSKILAAYLPFQWPSYIESLPSRSVPWQKVRRPRKERPLSCYRNTQSPSWWSHSMSWHLNPEED